MRSLFSSYTYSTQYLPPERLCIFCGNGIGVIIEIRVDRPPAFPAARQDCSPAFQPVRRIAARVSPGTVCRMAFDEKRMRDAEAACLAARDANPDSAEAHGLLAHSLFNRNKRREALAVAERAVKLNPKLADAYVIIGGVRQEECATEEARSAYQRYLELEPKGSYAADLRAIFARLPAKL